jgi:pyruvate ferredoxin oxidoreductase beta subunit
MSTPTSRELEAIKSLKQIAREEFILPGTAVCGGCGGLEALRLAAKAIGPKTVFVNAAGCFTLLATFPYTPFKGSWLYTTMASAAAGAQGVRDALDVLIARGKMPAEDDVEVVVVAGDGSTYDMALSATSGAIFRGLDFWYFCYDNESYGNTGMQMSSATPYGARTLTTPVGENARAGTEHGKKDLFEIWRAHRPAYLATVSPRFPIDLTNKFLKAKKTAGTETIYRSRALPDGLALRSGTDRRLCPSGGGDWHLCAQRSHQWSRCPHLCAAAAPTGRGIPARARPLPPSLRAGSE